MLHASSHALNRLDRGLGRLRMLGLLVATIAALLITSPHAVQAQPSLPVLPVPAEVKAASQLLGLGRQRLALVVGLGRVGELDLPAVRRDTAAVAESLRRSGFLVMARSDLGIDELRRSLGEFRQRLDPGGAGLIYIAGVGANLDGRSWLVTRNLPATGQTPDAAALKAASLPLDELVLALQVTPTSLRALVVDAAVPPSKLPADWQGLATPAVPDGVMVLLSAQPGRTLPRWQPPALPSPPPADPRETAGSPFGSAFVHALLAAGHTGPQVLQATRRLALDATGQLVNPWLGGRTDDADALGAPTMPIAQWPETAARRAIAALGGQALDDLRRSARQAQGPAPDAAPPPSQVSPGAPATPLVSAGQAAATGAAVATVADAMQTSAAGVARAEAAKVAVAQAAATQAMGVAGAALGAASQELGGTSPGTIAPRAPDPTLPATREATREVRAADALTGATARGDVGKAATPTATATPATPPTVAPPRPPAVPVPPPLNPYGYASGDSFTYRRIDQWKGEPVGLVVQVIETLQSSGDLSAREGDDHQTLDAQGRVRSRSGPAGRSAFTPVEEFWWAKPKVGESRDVEFTEVFEHRDGRGERRWEGEIEVGEPTRIETSAGSFDVLPMEGEGWVREWRMPQRTRHDVKWWRTVWYSPELGHPVAIDILERDAGSRMLRKERLELVHINTSRSVPR